MQGPTLWVVSGVFSRFLFLCLAANSSQEWRRGRSLLKCKCAVGVGWGVVFSHFCVTIEKTDIQQVAIVSSTPGMQNHHVPRSRAWMVQLSNELASHTA